MNDLRRKIDVLEAEAMRLRDLLAYSGADAAAQGAAHDLISIAADARRSAALAASEARQALILESAIDYAIVTTDLTGRITGWNVGARNVLGWEEAEALGQLAHMFFTPEDRAANVIEKEDGEGSNAGPSHGRALALEVRRLAVLGVGADDATAARGRAAPGLPQDGA